MQAPRRIWNFANSMALGRKLDFLIVPGTGFLDDFSADPFGWPFAILRWSLAARLSGAELLMVSIGAGPINHPLSRWFMRQSALMATFRSYRDTISHEFMKTLGFSRPATASVPILLSPCRRQPKQSCRITIRSNISSG
ncbi:hypothetical protein HGG76_23685 [Ochrobactrum tritici]|uniref:Polysaccharide pyruvyl transferase domain-containing protein n=1 Tax=Brucella tritici TaxID=94626 RepID=A0A7X6JDY0_9HYPH|nr:hypothetical protein [Brucella tritici]